MDLDLKQTQSLARIIDLLDVGIFTLDAGGSFAGWSDGAERITGRARADVVGQPPALLDSEALTLEALWARVRDGEPFANGMVSLRHQDGHESYLLADLRRLEEDGALVGAVGALTDLTIHIQANRRLAEVKAPEKSRRVFQRMVGDSPEMQEVYERLEQAAKVDVTVLVRGETGTGKELAAHAIHSLSERKAKPLICVNCSAIPDPLLESELFGHVKGAFTGAVREKRGVFEAAQGGTLFLDEIGDLGPSVQVKLLRALQEREIRRVGGEKSIQVDVRIVSATHRNLAAMVAAGEFREDLYYRLRVFELVMPPLRERAGDVAHVAEHFVEEFATRHKKQVSGFEEDALDCLRRYPWPGNVRELRNAIEHAFVTVKGERLAARDLPREVRGAAPAQASPAAPAAANAGASVPLKPGKLSAEEDRRRIVAALREAGGKKSLAASMLGMSRVTLWKRIKKYGINPVYEG